MTISCVTSIPKKMYKTWLLMIENKIVNVDAHEDQKHSKHTN